MHEELGRNTNGVWWAHGRRLQRALTRHAGADRRATSCRPCAASAPTPTRSPRAARAPTPAGSHATAERTAGGWRIRGEKWFVTSGDVSDFYIVMVNVVDGDGRLPTLFLVDRDRPGIEIVDDPPFTHNYPHGHPTVRFDCEVAADAVLGGPEMIGRGGELQNEWFIEERIHIAARCVGAMRRLLDEAVAWAIGREQFGRAHLRLPGRQLPAGRLGRRLRRGAPADLPGGPARRRRRRSQARPWAGGDGEAVRLGGGLALRRPLRAGARRARVHAHVSPPSASCASCASTASGRARARSSA